MRFILTVAAALLVSQAHGQTREEWIALSTRVHGGFGVLIPIGIRIGLDAQGRLKAEPRGLSVTCFMGEKAPCPCIVDGVMIATQASPGQGTLTVAPEKAPAGVYAIVVVRNRKSGAAAQYTISDAAIPKIVDWNRTLDPAGRYDAAMGAEGMFKVEEISN